MISCSFPICLVEDHNFSDFNTTSSLPPHSSHPATAWVCDAYFSNSREPAVLPGSSSFAFCDESCGKLT